jgi:hypothetical protein
MSSRGQRHQLFISLKATCIHVLGIRSALSVAAPTSKPMSSIPPILRIHSRTVGREVAFASRRLVPSSVNVICPAGPQHGRAVPTTYAEQRTGRSGERDIAGTRARCGHRFRACRICRAGSSKLPHTFRESMIDKKKRVLSINGFFRLCCAGELNNVRLRLRLRRTSRTRDMKR